MIDGFKFLVEDIRRVFGGGPFKDTGKGVSFPCPAHGGEGLNLSALPDDDGFVYATNLTCFSKSCAPEVIAQALIARGVPNVWSETLSRSDAIRGRKVVNTIEWIVRNYNGDAILKRIRREYERKPGEKKAPKDYRSTLPNGQPIPKKGQPGAVALADVLYGMERLRLYPEAPVVICEGEKAADAASRLGLKCVLGTVGASVRPGPEVFLRLRDRAVVFWRDADDEGAKQAEAFRVALRGVVERFAVFVNPRAAHGSKDDAAEYDGTFADFVTAIDRGEFEVRPPWPEDVTPIYDALPAAFAIYDRYVSGDTSAVIPTGYQTVDRSIRGGLEGGEVYLLGAPTGGGKTTIMQDFAERIAERGPVLFVTPEMTQASMALRALIKAAQAPMDSAAPWVEDQSQRQRAIDEMARAYGRLMERRLPILIFDKPDATMDDIEDRARRIPNLKAVVIDYAQQVASLESRQARYLQVGEVATRATVIAKTLNVPVLLASQVNRSVEDGKKKGTSGRTVYSFRETAMLEHKASVVLIFDRALDEDGVPARGEAMTPDELPALLTCQKNRHGRIFDPVFMLWDPGRFRVWQSFEERRGPRRAERSPSEPVEAELVAAGTPPPALPGPVNGSLFRD